MAHDPLHSAVADDPLRVSKGARAMVEASAVT